MSNVYNFSFEEFEKYINTLTQSTRYLPEKIRENRKNKFTSIEDIDEFYNSSDAIEFFQNEMLNGQK